MSKKTNIQRRKAIEILLHSLIPKIDIIWDASWAYSPARKTIIGDANNLSIISTLHEYAHARTEWISDFDSEKKKELAACAISVGIFREIFPKSYARLEWNGHMLQMPEKSR